MQQVTILVWRHRKHERWYMIQHKGPKFPLPLIASGYTPEECDRRMRKTLDYNYGVGVWRLEECAEEKQLYITPDGQPRSTAKAVV